LSGRLWGRTVAALLIVVLAGAGAAIVVSRQGGSISSTTSLPSSTTSSTPASSTTSSPTVYRVIQANLTLTGLPATIPCTFIFPFGDGACNSADDASLPHVELVQYGSSYYYYLQNQSASTGYGTGPCPSNCVHYQYDIWFTNSTVFCVSYALPTGNVCPSLPYGNDTITIPTRTAWSLDPHTGLRLNLTLSSVAPGVLNVAVSEFNTLDHANNMTYSSGFPAGAADFFEWVGGICSTSSLGYEVLQGNYGANNFTQGTPLALAIQSPVQCFSAQTDYLLFKPQSEGANLSRASSGFWMGGFEVYAGNACSSNLNPSPSCRLSFVPFAPGPYTVAAADRWGKEIFLHFTIQY